MAYVPYAPSFSDTYWLISPDGSVTARFNGSVADPNWCGVLTDVGGLDSAIIRESAEELVEADGGVHGNFWLGRRPIVLTGMTYGHSTVDQRTARLDRISRASQGFRGDCELHWQPQSAGAPEMMTWVRRQAEVKYAEGWNKTFQIPLVSQYARLFSATLHTITQAQTNGSFVTVNAENQGSYDSLPALKAYGPVTNPTIVNTTNSVVQAATLISGNAQITVTSTAGITQGMTVIGGGGIPAGATVQTVDSGTTLTLTAAATASITTGVIFNPGKVLYIIGVIGAGASIEADMLYHTAKWQNGSDATSTLDFLRSTWPTVTKSAVNNFTMIWSPPGTGPDANTSLQATWRDTWV